MAHLIDKSALVAEIEKRRKNWWYGSSIEAKYKREECDDILSFLDTIEAKEVDLDTEQRRYLTKYFNVYDDGILQSKKSQLPLSTCDVINVAKHFYELGLKAQEGEEV